MTTGWPHAYEYRIDNSPVSGDGYALGPADVESAASPVQTLLADTIGQDEVRDAMEEVTQTAFAKDALERILMEDRAVEEWRVGEALAEHHLAEDFDCEFPWPSGRDLKNPGTSTGGVDLVGFCHSDGGTRFALGEVKTSCQQSWPPSVVTGRHGLVKQLEGLRNNDDRKRWAIRYLAMHAVDKAWFGTFQAAFVRYGADESDVALFGTLVHVAEPKRVDLESRVEALAAGCPELTSINLFGLHLEPGALDELAGTGVTMETQ